jgi:hypothetical protein
MGAGRTIKRLRRSAKRVFAMSSNDQFEPTPMRPLARNKDRDDEPLITRRMRSATKTLARSVVRAPHDQRSVVLIFGCQRSGTTMLQQTFLDQSWRVLILEEHDRRLVGDDPEETSWEDIPTVFQRIHRLPFEVVAAKALVESFRVSELVDAAGGAGGAGGAKAIWMLRHYKDVARSNLKRFGTENPFQDLEPFRSGDTLDWHYRGATQQTRDTVVDLLSAGLSPLDAAALFWWTRNQLYFDLRLWDEERIRILRYEQACTCPGVVVQKLSTYIGISLPQRSIVKKVRAQPSAVTLDDLNPEVERLCKEMWEAFVGCPEL